MAGLWGRYIAPGGAIPYRPSIFDIQGAHAPLRPRKGVAGSPSEGGWGYWETGQTGNER